MASSVMPHLIGVEDWPQSNGAIFNSSRRCVIAMRRTPKLFSDHFVGCRAEQGFLCDGPRVAMGHARDLSSADAQCNYLGKPPAWCK